jgi:hypothetical protein
MLDWLVGLVGVLDGLVGVLDGLARIRGRLAGLLDGPASPPPGVRPVNSSAKRAAEKVTSPGESTVTGAAAPDAVSVRGRPREMAVAGDLRSRQIAAPRLVPSVTLVLRFAVSRTAAAFSRARSATAARGRVTAIPMPVGWIGLPAVPAAGKVPVTRVLTGRGTEGNAQV